MSSTSSSSASPRRPSYVRRDGDRNLRSTLRLGRTLLRLLGTKHLDVLDEDRRTVDAWVARNPGPDASLDQLLSYCVAYRPLFQHLLRPAHRHHVRRRPRLVGAHRPVRQGRSVRPARHRARRHRWRRLRWSVDGDVGSGPPGRRGPRSVDSAFEEGVDGLLDRLADDPSAAGWLAEYGRFVAAFGSRGPNEWDLGSDPWEFRPELALAAIDRMRAAPDTPRAGRPGEAVGGRACARRRARPRRPQPGRPLAVRQGVAGDDPVLAGPGADEDDGDPGDPGGSPGPPRPRRPGRGAAVGRRRPGSRAC